MRGEQDKRHALLATKEVSSTTVVTIHFNQDYIEVRDQDESTVFNEILSCFDFYHTWERSMLSLIARGGSAQTLIDKSAEVFPYPMIVADGHTLVRAITSWETDQDDIYLYARDHGKFNLHDVKDMNDRLDADNIYSSKRATNITARFKNGKRIKHARLRTNLWIKGKFSGVIVAFNPQKDFDRADAYILERLALFVQESISIRSKDLLDDTELGEYLTCMLDDEKYEKSRLLALLERTGWKYNECYRALRIEYRKQTHLSPYLIGHTQMVMQVLGKCCVFLYENGICALVNEDESWDSEVIKKKLLDLLDDKVFVIGMSYRFHDVFQFDNYYQQASRCAYYGRYFSMENPVQAESIALGEISQLSKNNKELSLFIHTDVSALINYDLSNKTELAISLFRYLIAGGNSTDAARDLGIHRNTINYRIKKIKSIVSLDIDKYENRLLLIGSFLLYGMR